MESRIDPNTLKQVIAYLTEGNSKEDLAEMYLEVLTDEALDVLVKEVERSEQ